jgi:NADH-quinone oxidoreductase subunit E
LWAQKIRKAEESLSRIKDILKRHPVNRGSLIPVLQDVQEDFGYLSEEAIEELAELMGISANEIYGVATFYTQFRFSPPGRHNIQSCQGTACHVRGGRQILTDLEQRLGINAGQTTADGQFDLERVACVGCCALAPVVAVDGKVYAQVTAKKIPSVLSQYDGKKGMENA